MLLSTAPVPATALNLMGDGTVFTSPAEKEGGGLNLLDLPPEVRFLPTPLFQ